MNPIKKLIINECACYSKSLNSILDYCDREPNEDCRCSILKNERCGYFERAVKPLLNDIRYPSKSSQN